MLAEERRQRMVEMVAENATVSVAEFANLFDTSESTIRRDLDRLEAAGLLVKVHGGAASVETALTPAPFVAVEPTMAEKRDLHTPEKHVLAAWAAAQIQPDDFVYLDSGSTTQAIVEHLSDTACLATFVTNSVSLALALANHGARTIVIGGDVKAGTEAIVGPGALDALSRYNFSKGFWGANGVTVEQGFTTPDTSEAMVKLESMKRARERFVLADASKIGVVTPVTFSRFEDATLVTCGAVDPAISALSNVVEVSA